MVLNLEGVAHKRFLRVTLQFNFHLFVVCVEAHVLLVLRRGQIFADTVQEVLHALVLVGRAHEHGAELQKQGLAPDGSVHCLDRDLIGLEEDLSKRVVKVGQRLQELVPVLGNLVSHLCRNVSNAVALAVHSLEVARLLRHQVANTYEVVLLADWQLDWLHCETKLCSDLSQHVEWIRAITIKLVDEDDTGHPVALHLPIDGDGLALDPADAAAN
mmetsp:Transcript_41351/g.66792  ORF Transcript_41351/g.66792 Transcript_41351/m.66792 type:complete len:215 (-) Transcript_41351:147-791(-)